MISKDSLLFLEQLSKNNNKEWFDINRKIYQNYRTEFIEFIQQWINELSHFDTEIENIEAKNCSIRDYHTLRSTFPGRSDESMATCAGCSVFARHYFRNLG